MKKLWVDDIRQPPDESWEIVCDYKQAINKLTNNKYDVISLDHDLGDFSGDRERTGYDILMWMVERKETGIYGIPSTVYIHTANPPARIKMTQVVDKYWNGR